MPQLTVENVEIKGTPRVSPSVSRSNKQTVEQSQMKIEQKWIKQMIETFKDESNNPRNNFRHIVFWQRLASPDELIFIQCWIF